jgi:ABC-type uncharacterized transport system involved in gliding motility auxiliary subunit
MRTHALARVLGALGLVLLASTVVTLFFGDGRFVLAKAALGTAALAASLALAPPGGAKRFFTGRAAHFGLFTTLSALLVVAILGVANWAAWKTPVTWDLTKDRLFTFAEDTVRTLGALDEDVTALAFYREDEAQYAVAEDLLARYAAGSGRFRYELVDPYAAPERVKRFGITDAGPRIVLLAGERQARVATPTEAELTNGLVQVTQRKAPRVYFTTGHGEADPSVPPDSADSSGSGARSLATAAGRLAAEGFAPAPLSLLEQGAVPGDAAAVLVVGARKPFLEPEAQALRAFLERGGALGVYLEPEVDAGLDPLLAEWGIEADDDLVVDPSPVSRLFGGSPVTPIVSASRDHPIARDLAGVGVALPTARSLVALTNAKVLPAPVLLTSEAAWGETRIRELFTDGAEQDDGEKSGPMPVALAVEAPRADGAAPEGPSVARPSTERAGGRVLVVGDSEFLDDRYQQVLGNLDFFLNGVAWLAEEPARITIRPKSREGSRLFLTEAQVSAIRFVTIDALPVALLALGLAVWLVRRSR